MEARWHWSVRGWCGLRTDLMGHWWNTEALKGRLPMVDALCIFRVNGSPHSWLGFPVFKNSLSMAKSKTICEVASHLWYVSFCRVRQDVHTSICCNRSRNCQYQRRSTMATVESMSSLRMVFTVVGFIRNNGKWVLQISVPRCCWDRNKFRLLANNGNLKALRISMFLNQVEVHWLFVERATWTGRIHWVHHQKSNDGIWFEAHDLCTVQRLIIWIWFYVTKDLVNHLVATKVKAVRWYDQGKLYHSVVCNDHDVQRHDIFVGIQLNRSKYVLKVSSIACYFSGVRLFDIQEVDGITLSPTELRPWNHIQVMMARHYESIPDTTESRRRGCR